jgi:hypothetical protein
MSFDLNLDNYTKKELVEMFDLPSNYDRNILDMKESKLRESIMNNKEINTNTKEKTIQFLIQAKTILLNSPNSLNNQNQNQNSDLKETIMGIYNTNFELKPSKLEGTEEHMVQVRKGGPFVSSNPGEFFPGVINPLIKGTIRKHLNIDSRFRDNYFASPSTNFNVNLPTNFNNVLQMQLNAIELPTTFYIFSKQYNNNFFTITVNTLTMVVSIPDGNYTHEGIVNVINNELSLLGSPFNEVTFLLNINNNSGSGQMMVGPIVGSTITSLSLNFQADRFGLDDRNTPLPLKFGWLLGFRNGIYTNNLNYVSEGVVDITGPKYIYLVVDDHNNNVNNGFYSAFYSSVLNNNILARISLQSRFFDVQLSNNLSILTNRKEYFGPVNLQILNIQLLDEYGRVVDLNNMDFSFCLTLVTAYDV